VPNFGAIGAEPTELEKRRVLFNLNRDRIHCTTRTDFSDKVASDKAKRAPKMRVSNLGSIGGGRRKRGKA
jgi:hypothetical protein